MKKIISIALVFMLCVTLFACGNSDGEKTTDYKVSQDMTDMYNAFIEAVDTEFAYNIAVALSENEEFRSSALGSRTAGSEAEHAAADWLVSQMNEIGLTDVAKEGAKCDLWQFNSASFQIEGDDREILPYSYATAATPESGITAEVVYAGTGTRFDYEEISVEGKIVLVDINQRDDWWVTYPMLEAQHQGALAVMSVQSGGFSEVNDDALNCQDICGPTGIPCVSISANDANYIKEKLEAGPVTATLKVDNEIAVGKGTTYNVVGRIKGKSSENQIIIGGHYDMHFSGFQDDCSSIGMSLAIAKAMIDSEYVPENDIVICLHGAEEWGASNTIFDWCTGAWEMINTLHPEWQNKTLAFINFELSAYEFDRYTSTYSAPEMFSMLDFFKNTYPLSPEPVGCFPDGVLTEGYQTYTYSDDFSYYAAGVPSTVNGFLLDKDMEGVFPFYKQLYHTNFDTKDTYNENVMDFNIKYYGAFAMYVDQTPALYLDFTSQFDRLSDSVDEEIMTEAGVDVEEYRAELENLRIAAEQLKEAVVALNDEYNQARLDGSDEDTLASLRDDGKKLTKKNLEIFNFAQDELLGLMYEWPIVPHESAQYNISIMKDTVVALETGDMEAALDSAMAVNNYLEVTPMYFSPEVVDIERNMIWGKENKDNLYWGTGKIFVKANVEEASRNLIDKSESEDVDFTKEIEIYEREIEAQYKVLAESANLEINAVKAMTKMLGEQE